MIAATPAERRPLGALGAGSQRDGEFGEERDFRGRIHGQWNGAKHNPEVGLEGSSPELDIRWGWMYPHERCQLVNGLDGGQG